MAKKEDKKEDVQPEELTAGEAESVEEEAEEIVEDINEENEIDKLNQEIARLKNDYARAYADTDNLKKRLNAEAELVRKYRIQDFAKEILPVLDNLERALATQVEEADEAFKKGVEMTYDQLLNALKKEGVEVIDCLDKPFDPNVAQAILQQKIEDKESGIVVEVLQKGYKLKDRILRPAMVKISE